MEQLIWQCFLDYGWQFVLIACGGIFLLGIFKFFHVFDKIEKETRKYIYAGASLLYSAVASLIYLAVVEKLNVTNYFSAVGVIYALNSVLYYFYENYGVRKMLRWLGELALKIRDNIKAVKTEEVVKDELGGDNLVDLEDFSAFETTSINRTNNTIK